MTRCWDGPVDSSIRGVLREDGTPINTSPQITPGTMCAHLWAYDCCGHQDSEIDTCLELLHIAASLVCGPDKVWELVSQDWRHQLKFFVRRFFAFCGGLVPEELAAPPAVVPAQAHVPGRAVANDRLHGSRHAAPAPFGARTFGQRSENSGGCGSQFLEI